MTQEDKELLLTDLCARLPYRPKGVKLHTLFDPEDIIVIGYTGKFVETDNDEIPVEKVRLYLRPQSSMTEEQKQLVRWFKSDIKTQGAIDLYMNRYIEWLDSRHFDWRTDGNGKTLIEKGLAIEAPKEMYNI